MIKSKSMAVATAALAMCMAGSAFAQDARFDRGPGRNDRAVVQQQQQQFPQQRYQQQQHPRHDARGHDDRRNDWRADYRPGRQFDRRGYPAPHADWRRGGRVPTEYRGGQYVVNDWRGQQLQQPQPGYQWVGVGGDFVLAAVATGLIAQIIAGQ